MADFYQGSLWRRKEAAFDKSRTGVYTLRIQIEIRRRFASIYANPDGSKSLLSRLNE